MRPLLLLAALAAAAAAQDSSAPRMPVARRAASSAPGGCANIVAFDAQGKALDAAGLVEHIARADRRGPPALSASSPDGLTSTRPTLSQRGDLVVLCWEGLPRVTLSLPWPVFEDGFSTVLVDREGRGIADGDTIRLNEEIALTQYRLFKEAWLKHIKDRDPQYQPGAKAKKLADQARDSLAAAQAAKEPPARAQKFERALADVSIAWQKLLVEHGEQIAAGKNTGAALRLGLTLDESLLRRLDHHEWIVDAVGRSGSNWVRVVFRANPTDFVYAKQASFNEYDAVIKQLRARGLRVMGCVLDTAQWPATLSAGVYAERTRNLVLHFKGQINSWEVGSEINGNWLGGQRAPLSAEQVFHIFSAGAAEVKKIEPGLETVATLYWWEGTAPDDEHALFGWLRKYAPRGFDKNIDVVGISLWPEDNPVGMSLERIFEHVHMALPGMRLMVGSYGYVEGETLKGFWWLDPRDVDGARKDLITLITAGSCALDRSVGGGFWWQALDQMMPAKKRVTDLYRVYKQAAMAVIPERD